MVLVLTPQYTHYSRQELYCATNETESPVEFYSIATSVDRQLKIRDVYPKQIAPIQQQPQTTFVRHMSGRHNEMTTMALHCHHTSAAFQQN